MTSDLAWKESMTRAVFEAEHAPWDQRSDPAFDLALKRSQRAAEGVAREIAKYLQLHERPGAARELVRKFGGVNENPS